MRNKLSIAFIGLFSSFSYCQTETIDIDRQVWYPFIEAYASWDYETFNALHGDSMIRINSKEIWSAQQYKNQNISWFKKASREGYKQSIMLRFERRIVTGPIAFETGYYRIIITKPNGNSSNYYARFHVTLNKENDAWKITQDWDSTVINGEPVTVADFNRLEPFNQ